MPHTKGPWKVLKGTWPLAKGGTHPTYTIHSDLDQDLYGKTICDVFHTVAEAATNASLIAAAPDLLAALETAIEDLEACMGFSDIDRKTTGLKDILWAVHRRAGQHINALREAVEKAEAE